MPGAGKSTVGVVLAKLAGLYFLDTDLEIQRREQATLQQILERKGYRYLRQVEEQVLLQLPLSGAVISTGGSAVYSKRVMARLQAAGPVVFLHCDLQTLEQRVAAGPDRGIASDPDSSFAEIYAERVPLYRRYADIVVEAGTAGAEQVAAAILARIQGPDMSADT